MKEIIAKLAAMGVAAKSAQINSWLKTNNKGLGTLDDLDIVAMGRDLSVAGLVPSIAGAIKQPQGTSVEPVAPNFERVDRVSVEAELRAIEELGAKEGEIDAGLLFDAHERGYTRAFARRVDQGKNFRSQLFARAASAIKGA